MPTKKQQQSRKRKNCTNECTCLAVANNRKKKQQKKRRVDPGVVRLQDALLSPDYIIRKVFRKDGPPLGSDFDSLPSHAFHLCKGKDSRKSHRACQENQRALKKQKVVTSDDQITNENSAPVKRHGMGKGLMTVWRLTNPNSGDIPTGVDFGQNASSRIPASISTKLIVREKKKKPRRQQSATRRIGHKVQDKNKSSTRSKKVQKSSTRSKKVKCQQIENLKEPHKGKCELALECGMFEDDLEQCAMLVDDEELELREQQAGPSPLMCSAHFASNGLHGCSLCKDLLAKFPPNSVTMKQPLYMQPWDSSSELVKKLFKVFHFLCTFAVTIGISSFTLDEFAESFHEKDSLLLGKVNVALLEVLLSDIETELNNGLLCYVSRNCKYVALLHSVERQDFVLKSWKEFLNSLTWTELFRQVMVAAGFGSKYATSLVEPLNKEANLMDKYGLSADTLKGELFSILLLRGNNGSKVSELAKTSSIIELKLAATADELEILISSMLSSDITLFEKISSSAYRLRINTVVDPENVESDYDDIGSVDDKDSYKYSSTDDSEDDSGASGPSRLRLSNQYKSRNNMSVDNEIDESHPGEVWLLGLIEGEYSDLNIEEKLNALEALIDLVSAGSSFRMEDPATSIAECVPYSNHIGSGAKIKRSTAKSRGIPCGQTISISEANTRMQPIDSSRSILKVQNKCSNRKKDTKDSKVVDELHPMQSIFLGSDRRYNRYWLFLGPCCMYDPGHKRIYFESSEDGHWEVIDSEEALRILLSSLDRRGRRESQLLSSLEKREVLLFRAMSSMEKEAEAGQPAQSGESERSMSVEDSSSAISDVDNLLGIHEMQNDFMDSAGPIICQIGKKGEQHKQNWGRLQAFDMWLWNSFYSELNAVKHGKRSYLDSLARCDRCHDLYWRDEKHCKICHTTFELDFDLEERYAIHAATCSDHSDLNAFPKHKVLSSQLQSLKAAIYAIESSMPDGAMVGVWTKSAHNLWVKRLRRTSTLLELLQVVTDFVGGLNEEWLYQCDIAFGSRSAIEEIIVSFPDLPQTSSAVALWLVKLDALIAPHLLRVVPEKNTYLGYRPRGKHASSR